jgi:hypothetical protein
LPGRVTATIGLSTLNPIPCVLFTVRSAVNFEVAVGKRPSTIEAAEAAHMIFDLCLIFHVLTLDSTATAPAQTTIEFMVVELTKWLVIEHVELGRGEWFRTRGADEASLVISSR